MMDSGALPSVEGVADAPDAPRVAASNAGSSQRRRRLLDAFCCGGGAGKGYADAGFEVVGVDIAPQPLYPFEFHQADALDVLARLVAGETWDGYELTDFDAIHASPPCQHYSAAANIHDTADDHPDLIPPTRALLEQTGLPWVIENVERSTLFNPFRLCGSMFGLGVLRHRLFESNVFMLAPPCGSHRKWYASVFGGRAVGRQRVTGAKAGAGQRTQTWDKFDDELATARAAMGIDWLSLKELSEAIPPAYTQHIGAALMTHLDYLDSLEVSA